eukprot:TRINITY_DN74409_c0_g1_i1.p1 TRINITY_DN74409_c0_g1~~TRINITY_DN74409_c0_g1_i1.p1  ORF type:complete len:290 (-),score=30.19 TRINITY_DN74409_c0_g1_i1:44-913(-)
MACRCLFVTFAVADLNGAFKSSSALEIHNVYGEPLVACGAGSPGSGDGDFCTPRLGDRGAHHVCVPSLSASFSANTGQGSWSTGFGGRPWCICVWAYLHHRGREVRDGIDRLSINCSAVPWQALAVAGPVSSKLLCDECAAAAWGDPTLAESVKPLRASNLARTCQQVQDGTLTWSTDSNVSSFILLLIFTLLLSQLIGFVVASDFLVDASKRLLSTLAPLRPVMSCGPAEGPCRICHDEGACVAVCACKGSMRAVHLSCLEAWRRRGPSSGRNQCEVCREHYRLSKAG